MLHYTTYYLCMDCHTAICVSYLMENFEPILSLVGCQSIINHVNPFKPEFILVIFIHYKPRIAAAILDL